MNNCLNSHSKEPITSHPTCFLLAQTHATRATIEASVSGGPWMLVDVILAGWRARRNYYERWRNVYCSDM